MDTHPDKPEEARLIQFPVKTSRRRTPDPLGYWLCAGVTIAFLAAGVITWRTGFSDPGPASFPVAATPAAQSDPADVPPIYAHVEGVDP